VLTDIARSKPSSLCAHTHRRFCRVPFLRRGGVVGAHIMERCQTCGVNCRGAGIWVARREIRRMGLDPDDLPIVPGKEPLSQPSTPTNTEERDGYI
jgi:hypothetical protein